MNMWLMYLVLTLDNVGETFKHIQVGLVPIVIILGAGLIASFIATSLYKEDDASCEMYLTKIFPKLLRVFKIILIVEILAIVITTFVPTTKQAAAIYFVPKVINNKQIQKMPSKLVTLANSWMDEQIKTIKSK